MKIPEFAPQVFEMLGMQAVRLITDVLTILRGNVTLRDHINLQTVTHTFGGVADTEEDVDVTDLILGYTPSYFLTIEVDDGAVVYPSSKGSWTSTIIKAKSSKAGSTVTLAVF